MFRLLTTSRRSLSRRNGQRMTRISWPSGPFAPRFWHWLGFFDHRKAHWAPSRRPLTPARRFSACFGLFGRCAQLCQNSWHDSTHLPRGHHLSSPFPRPKARLTQRSRQHQLIHSRGYHQAPALKLSRRAHPCFRPEEILLEKAIGVLMREAVAIGCCHLLKRERSAANPAKPTLAWIASGSPGAFSQDAIDAHLDLSCLSEMQAVPGLHQDRLASFIAALPLLLWLAPGLGATSLKERPIFARGPSFSRWQRWYRSIELAIAFEAQQSLYREPLAGEQEGSGRVPAIGQHTRVSRQQRTQLLQLLYPNRDRRLLAFDTSLREDCSPTAAPGGQEHDRRELPAHAHRFGSVRQIADVDHASIRTGLGFGPSNARAVKAEPDRSLVLRKQGRRPGTAPARFINAPVGERFIDAGPLASEGRRQRQFGQRSGCTFTGQGIRQLEERIATASKTAIRLMTYALQYVKVQGVSVLCFWVFRAKNFTSFGSFWQSRGCLLLCIV